MTPLTSGNLKIWYSSDVNEILDEKDKRDLNKYCQGLAELYDAYIRISTEELMKEFEAGQRRYRLLKSTRFSDFFEAEGERTESHKWN